MTKTASHWKQFACSIALKMTAGHMWVFFICLDPWFQNIKEWRLTQDFCTVLYILTCCMCLFSQHWFLDSASESSDSLTCGCKSTSGPIKVYWTSENTIIDGMASVTYFRLYWIKIWVHFANVVHMFQKGGLSGILLANDWWLTS